VKFPDVLDQLPSDRTVRRGKRRSGSAEDEGADRAYGFAGVPIGVFVVQGDDADHDHGL
jgi:hypothetical protein